MKKNNDLIVGTYAENEIEFIDIIMILWQRKFIIFFVTFILTILGSIYDSSKSPVYESSALLQVGSYKNIPNLYTHEYVLLENPINLHKKLESLFFSNDSGVSSILISKEEFLEIKAEGFSSKIAEENLLTIISYVKNKHKSILDAYIKSRELELDSINIQINNIKKSRVKSPSYISNNDFSNESTSISDLLLKEIIHLENIKQKLQFLLLPHNSNKTKVIGEISTGNNPVKPNKKLIILASLLGGLIFSIFLALIVNALSSNKLHINQ